MRILVVDDEHSVRGFVARCLMIYSHEVDTAVTDHEAFSLIRRHKFDAIIANLPVPLLFEGGFVKKLKAQQPDMKILLMADSENELERIDGFSQSVDDIIVKPFTVRLLMDAVDRMLDCSRHHINHGDQQTL